MIDNLRYWLTRKLLNLAWRINPGMNAFYDAQMGWSFNARWKQPPASPSDQAEKGGNHARL